MPRPLEKIDIGCLVTGESLFDFSILYESLVESWGSYPFTLHAFTVEDEVTARLADLAFEHVEVHRSEATLPLDLIERSGLERCIVTDVDNLFLSQTPELSLLLSDCDLVVVDGPAADRPIQSSLWSFRRTARSIAFADEWRARSSEPGADASRVLGELLGRDPLDAVANRVPDSYCLDADLPQLTLRRDPLGFREVRTGLVKVLHFGGIDGRANGALGERIEFVARHFPQAAAVLSLYGRLARRAAVKLDLEAVPRVDLFVRDRLLEAGVPLTRNHLPALLNRRGLHGTGVEVGVKVGNYSESILRAWEGQRLISVDAWGNGVPADAGDPSTPEEHERFYGETLDRLGKFGERSAVWRMTSVEAASRIEGGSLDFVYIDARHDFDSVTEDLEHWFGKIRPGGVFAGHDYIDSDNPSYQVKPAVDEFFAARGLPVKATYGEGRTASWVVEIPAR